MSKDKKNTDIHFTVILKTVFIILIITFFTYSIMAVITHFSLNYKSENYLFIDSIKSVFDTTTAIFKFFAAFILLNIVWVTVAIFIRFIKNKFFDKYD
jgi:hypothetical protein